MVNKRIYRIRQKICKTGVFMFIIAFMFAVLSCIDGKFIPIFAFILTDWIMTIIPSYYIEVIEKEG